MPCNSGPPSYEEGFQAGLRKGITQSSEHHPDDTTKINELTQQNNYLEACLCALLSELVKEGIENKVIDNATRNGKIDIMLFWTKHKSNDINRLKKILKDDFSPHELDMMRKILNEGK